MIFRDRHDAGCQLAGQLETLSCEWPVVIGLARGGIPVAFEVALALDAPLEVLVVRKLGAPGKPELALGAVAEEHVRVLDREMTELLGVTQTALDAVLDRESAELRRRVDTYRDGRTPYPLEGRTVIVVDDGMATGLTDLAALRAVRRRGAARVVIASPVGSSDSIGRLRPEADRIICFSVPARLANVGRWYEDFSQVSDAEVIALLEQAHARNARPAVAGA